MDLRDDQVRRLHRADDRMEAEQILDPHLGNHCSAGYGSKFENDLDFLMIKSNFLNSILKIICKNQFSEFSNIKDSDETRDRA